MRRANRILFFLLTLFACQAGLAHTTSLSYLDVTPHDEKLAVQWSISLADLNEEIPLDANNDLVITWGELRQRQPALKNLFGKALQFDRGSRTCSPDANVDLQVETRQSEPFAVLIGSFDCHGASGETNVRYTFLAQRNRQHRVIVTTHRIKAEAETLVAAPTGEPVHLPLKGDDSLHSFLGFVNHGFHHILNGWDHILFVLTLILSAMVPLHAAVAAEPLRQRLLTLLKLVSIFTLAHSLTLALSSMKIVTLPAIIVEPGIALSIVFTAVNNIWPVLGRHREGYLVFVFGLLHGMGFASMLNDLMLSTSHRVLALAGFNIGVELGQLLIVLMAMPVLLMPVLTARGRNGLAWAMSLVIACVGSYWFVSRIFPEVTLAALLSLR
ncbi:HupE/UreJ family protein [Dyella subtropica]|uniref:HupE/UreJ family protein n=1 Tax=Dyella subtropica TaxID=2992127 RepID=UPI00224D11CC|nr:HupE/UreJ family protein [Dyella subtropica]